MLTNSSAQEAQNAERTKITVSHILGEIAWLMSQSASHRDLRIRDLNSMVMPPILKRQFHLFRQDDKPVGVAIWASLDGAGETKMMSGLSANGEVLEDSDWNAGDHLWLIDLIAPFATIDNRQFELMFGDLITGIFKGRSFKMIDKGATDPAKRILTVGETAGADLVRLVTEQLPTTGNAP